MPQLVKIDELFDPIRIGLFGTQAIVQVTNLLSHLIQQPGGLENRQAGFSGIVMTVHSYSISVKTVIASHFSAHCQSDVRETTAMLGRQVASPYIEVSRRIKCSRAA